MLERLKNLAAVLGGLSTLVGLLLLINAAMKPGLVGRLECGAMAYPPMLEEHLTRLVKQLSPDLYVTNGLSSEFLKDDSDWSNLPPFTKKRVILGIVNSLPGQMAVQMPYDLAGIQSIWTGSVSNKSSTRVTSVQLYIPEAKFALVEREDNTHNGQKVDNVITLGDLNPGETAQITVWSHRNSKFSRPEEDFLTVLASANSQYQDPYPGLGRM